MDLARLEELKQDLLNGRLGRHRRLLIGLGLFTLAFWTITVAGGYFLVTHAMDDNQATSTRGINTPTQVALLFAGHRPAELVNSLVFLNRVKIEPASDAAKVYYTGDESGTRLLVVAHQPSAPSEEAVANVMGTIRPLTSDLLKKWKFSKQEQKVLKAQGVYLDAESLKVRKSAATVAQK
ncbi:MAG: hypothetical protein ACXVZX_06030 [Terriglobales bacterium]